jgi:uncharacterized protein (DUF433 family)
MVNEVRSGEIVYQPLYTYADADYLAGVSRGTAKRWLAGYAYGRHQHTRVASPPITAVEEDREAVAFVDLVEITAIGGLKAMGFSLKQIRAVVENCQQILGVARPLTTLRFKTDGREIFVDRGESLLEIGRRKGQMAWAQVLDPFLATLDYNAEGVARRWWPQGRNMPVVIDPEFGFGFPVIAGSGVRTEIILEQFQAGALDDEIAEDFNLDPKDVQRALQFELRRAIAA